MNSIAVVRLNGRLGNQLFQYAFGESLRLRTGRTVLYSIRRREDFQLRHFLLNVNTLPERIFSLAERGSKLGLFPFNRHERTDIVFEVAPALKNGINFLDGFWQSEKFFKDYENHVRSLLVVKDVPSLYNKRLIEKIGDCNAVSIHVRRGDYLRSSVHKLLPDRYYWDAIDIIKGKFTDPWFFVFSDDIGECKRIFRGIKYLTFVDDNVDRAHEDFRLMMRCRHNIIANSTFSWWAAWLNRNKSKCVVSPAVWFEENSHFRFNMDDILPAGWLRIEIG